MTLRSMLLEEIERGGEVELGDAVVAVGEEEGKPKEGEDTDDAAVDAVAEEIERGGEVEWGENNTNVFRMPVMPVVGIKLQITGPHDPEDITDYPVGTTCVAKDRRREYSEANRTAVGEMSYEATLGLLWCANGDPWECVVYWTDAGYPSVVPFKDVEFHNKLGRRCRRKKITKFYADEQEPVRGRTRVKVGDGKAEAKARKRFNRVLQDTSNKEYNDITQILNDENVSNEDKYKRLAEMAENMEKIAI